MSAALFYLSNFYIGLFVWNPCGEITAAGVSVCLRTEGPAAGLFEAAHHRQIVAGVARAEVEPLREVERIVALLEAQTLIERLEILVRGYEHHGGHAAAAQLLDGLLYKCRGKAAAAPRLIGGDGVEVSRRAVCSADLDDVEHRYDMSGLVAAHEHVLGAVYLRQVEVYEGAVVAEDPLPQLAALDLAQRECPQRHLLLHGGGVVRHLRAAQSREAHVLFAVDHGVAARGKRTGETAVYHGEDALV